MLSWLQAIILGLIQGVSELFPISSLGHSVLLPTLFGWDNLSKSVSQPESFYLAFVVGLHVGTALGLLAYYRKDWVAIVGGLLSSARDRKIVTPVQRLGWLLVIATIPAGVMGLAFEHFFRTQFAKPLSAAVFLMVNGVILISGEVIRRRRLSAPVAGSTDIHHGRGGLSDAEVAKAGLKELKRLDDLSFPEAFVIGVAQVPALLAGISRSGITMVAGLVRGLDHEDSLRFSFLLATPIIFAAGVLKIPDLTGTLGNGIRFQAIAGAAVAAVAAYFSARFLVRWFQTRTLWPFGLYCLVVGAGFTAHFA
jgi:undecaprenyl-diphosphatase